MLYTVLTLRAIPNWRDTQTLADYSLEKSPNAAPVRIAHAFVLHYQHGDHEAAAREYELAIRLNQASPRPFTRVTYDAYVGLGVIAHARGEVGSAIEYLENAIRVSPNESPAHDALGSVYFPRREYAKAAEHFGRAVRANPQDLIARYYLGTCYLKLGRPGEAAEQFRAARQVDPSYLQAWLAEAEALDAAGDEKEAERVRALIPRP
jgi:tetratricopeptide (TPR) repeat protein